MEQTKRRSIVTKAVREAILAEDPEAVAKLKAKDSDATITLFGKEYTIPEAEQAVSRIYHSIGLAINLYDMVTEIDMINAIDELVEKGDILLPEEKECQETPRYLQDMDRFSFPSRFSKRHHNN